MSEVKSVSRMSIDDIKTTDTEIMRKAVRIRVRNVINIAKEESVFCNKFLTVDPVNEYVIDFNLKGATAGMCMSHKGLYHEGRYVSFGPHRLSFNHVMMIREWGRWDETVVHETCHLLQKYVDKDRPHGLIWQVLMQEFGLEPKRTHDYDVTGLIQRRRRSKRYLLYCSSECSARHFVTMTVIRRLRSGRQYKCRKCNVLLREL